MYVPVTEFGSKVTDQAKLVCYLASNLTKGVYQKHSVNMVFPPNVYSPHFWQAVNKPKIANYGKTFVLEAQIGLELMLTDDYKKQWDRIATKFWSVCSRDLMLDATIAKVKKIKVLVSKYGTTGSFYPTKTSSGYVLHLTYRSDLPIAYIARTILLALYKIESRKTAEVGEAQWHRRQGSVDHIISHSPLKSLLKDLSQPLPPSKYPSVAYQTGSIDLSHYTAKLTKKEYLLLENLVSKRGVVVNYEDLGDVIWGNQVEEKYSLYALNKHVQNLRRKSQLAIQTKKGEGYYLT